MEHPRLQRSDEINSAPAPPTPAAARTAAERRDVARAEAPFDVVFAQLFDQHFRQVFRFLDRLTGDPELAADLAQDAFVRLHQRGSVPDTPTAWLISVAMNLLRNARSLASRRRRLLTPTRATLSHSDAPLPPDDALIARETGRRVRAALDHLTERDRSLLLLRAEGYSYREIATSLGLTETSVGTFIVRAQRAFRVTYESSPNAS